MSKGYTFAPETDYAELDRRLGLSPDEAAEGAPRPTGFGLMAYLPRLFGRATAPEIDSPRALEAFLRDAGLSAKKAKRLVAGGWSAMVRAEPEPPSGREADLQAAADLAAQIIDLISKEIPDGQ